VTAPGAPDAPGTDRRALAAAVRDAASAVADLLAAHPLRAGAPYRIGAVLPGLAEEHRRLQAIVAGLPGPFAVDARGRQDGLVSDLGGLMMYLQLVQVVYRGLDELPAAMQPDAGRIIPLIHLTARRVRDAARR
jgi:hypothetical protein